LDKKITVLEYAAIGAASAVREASPSGEGNRAVALFINVNPQILLSIYT